MKCIFILLFIFSGYTLTAQTLCENGYAGQYPCNNVDFLAHVPPDSIGGASTNEVWGWTDSETGKEYVLLGMSTGVGFFDISNPVAPVYLGRLPTHTTNSIWRTLRTYNNYLFVGSEASGHGLQVFDLNLITNVASPPVIFSESAHYSLFGKCHTLVIDEDHGYLIACGTNTQSGGPHIVNIQNPLQPTYAGGYSGSGYTHEAQVITYNGPDQDYVGKTILFCFNGNAPTLLVILDITDPLDIEFISNTAYPQPQYCHQGWLTHDGAYMLMDDELDELDNGYSNTRTLIWDMHNLDAPLYMGKYDGTTEAIDHNQYIIGNLSYQSNYTAGLQILDVTNVADTILKQVAMFDHYPYNNATQFDGEWMNYPYFQSGVVALSDLYNGLFLVRPRFIDLAYENEICETETVHIDIAVDEGFTGPYQVTINGIENDASILVDGEELSAPAVLSVSIIPQETFTTDLNFTVTVQGLFNSYSMDAHINVSEQSQWFTDLDGDGYGNELQMIFSCPPGFGYSLVPGDCNDANENVYPNAPGTGENLDNNCNSQIDPSEQAFCADLDGDHLITVNDLIIMNGELGCAEENCPADLNDDGFVNAADFIILLSDFGEYCLE